MELSADLALCYRTLGLAPHATEPEIKQAYRRLARQYHPDVNPDDPSAEERFKQISLAYQALITAQIAPPSSAPRPAPPSPATRPAPPTTGAVRFQVQNPPPAASQASPQASSSSQPPAAPDLSPQELRIKLRMLNQLYGLMKGNKWLQAIGLSESLADRFPDDPDIRPWQALAYHRHGRSLLERKQLSQARIFLKKALQTDPHNRKLYSEIDQDFRRMERMLRL